ncbi:MAG: adenylyl-sulfate kinase [Chloracidobacterium sp.]|nr:adenylyl-sulfate kinase [Chloracidobacterium sp.]
MRWFDSSRRLQNYKRGKYVTRGFTLWFTGLSGAGKTTLTNALVPQLRARGVRIEVLDGDEVRANLSKGLGFSKEDRDTNIRRIGYVSRLLARNGVGVIAAAISPYREIRDEVRGSIEAEGAIFLEIFVKASLDALVARDVKGLYKKALAGEIKQFTGVSDPYEEPLSPELVVETDRETVEESAAKILARLEKLNLITAAHQIINRASKGANNGEGHAAEKKAAL